MAAVISVIQQSGEDYGDGDVVAKNVFYFIAEDANNVSANNSPVRIPVSGTNYSYEIYLRFRVDFAPVDSVFNFKVWIEDQKPDGVDITVNSDAVSDYSQPLNTESVAGTRTSFFDYTNVLEALSITGTLENIGDVTDFMVFQEEVSYSALPQSIDVNLNFSYDEI